MLYNKHFENGAPHADAADVAQQLNIFFRNRFVRRRRKEEKKNVRPYYGIRLKICFFRHACLLFVMTPSTTRRA
jgi:hypothetical protein